jgi:ketosteroid isomerase-like protein
MSLASLEHEEVEQFTHEFETLFNAGDAAGMASYYAEDARLLAEHARWSVGATRSSGSGGRRSAGPGRPTRCERSGWTR